MHWRRSWSKRRPLSRSHLQLRVIHRKRKAALASLQKFHCLPRLQTLTFPARYPWKAMKRISLKICPQATSMSVKWIEMLHIHTCICSTFKTHCLQMIITDNCRTRGTSLYLQMKSGLRTQAHQRQQTPVSSLKLHSPSVDDISVLYYNPLTSQYFLSCHFISINAFVSLISSSCNPLNFLPSLWFVNKHETTGFLMLFDK